VKQGETILVEKVQRASPAPQLPNLEPRALESAIALLTEEQRTTVLMVCLEGMRYEEVAQVCDVPIGTVRSRLSRAREELRRMMEGKIAQPGSRHGSRGEATPFKVEPVKGGGP
jgi:DNA-directed RNA polymerase specialized sigma24 family protein